MTYRTPKAQAIHSALLEYLKRPIEAHFTEFLASIDASDEESLSERSKNGHSHLVDLLHLANELCKSGEASLVVSRCFEVIMQKAQQYPKARSLLLLAAARLLLI